jgi:ketosteroid isomerase-like protein
MSADPTFELRDLYDRWFASISAKDASFVERQMDGALQIILPDGVRLDAAGYKAMYDALPAGSHAQYRIDEFVVRPLGAGAAALITGTYHGRIEYQGTVMSDKSVRFTSVWERQQDRWTLLVHHIGAM